MSNENNTEMYDGIAWRLIVNYLSGECSADELAEVKQWIKSDASHKLKIEALQKIWDAGWIDDNLNKTERAWSEIEKLINTEVQVKSLSLKPRIYSSMKQILKVAAVIIFIIGGYFLLQKFLPHTDKSYAAWNVKSTALGQKAILTLFDGTRITLNAESTLKYPKQFDRVSREVYLEGEAYFEVARNSSKPFVVHTNDVTTTVLGTVFNVKAFPEENSIMVSLVEGKIKVEKSNQTLKSTATILFPTQQYVLKRNHQSAEITNFDPVQITGWKNDIYKFENESLENVFVTLSRAFGIKFILADNSLKYKKITTLFNQDSFWTVVKVLQKFSDLEYKTIEQNGELEKIIFYRSKS